jgi:hypothetical protein
MSIRMGGGVGRDKGGVVGVGKVMMHAAGRLVALIEKAAVGSETINTLKGIGWVG